MTTSVHDLSNCTLTICGILVSGGGQGGFFKVTTPERFQMKSGVHGDVISYKTGENVYPFELTLLPTSPTNEELTSLVSNDLASVTGEGVGDLLFEDRTSGFTVRGKARLAGFPERSETAEPQDVTWKGAIADAHFDYSGTRG